LFGYIDFVLNGILGDESINIRYQNDIVSHDGCNAVENLLPGPEIQQEKKSNY
jgi:hypothetical protein